MSARRASEPRVDLGKSLPPSYELPASDEDEDYWGWCNRHEPVHEPGRPQLVRRGRDLRHESSCAVVPVSIEDTTVTVVIDRDGRVVGCGVHRPGGLKNDNLRRTPFGSVFDVARAAVREMEAAAAADPSLHHPEIVSESMDVAREAAGRLGPAAKELERARLAERYVHHVDRGTPDVLGQLEAEFAPVRRGTIRNRIREARRLGLLTETVRGKMGGRLTSKAERILAEHRAQAHEESP